MRSRRTFVLAFSLALLLPAVVQADDALSGAMLHAEGNALLAKADFDGALARYLAAARAAPGNPTFRQDALVLKRVVAQRKALDAPRRHPKWEGIAMSLHAFYLEHDLAGEAVALGRRGLKVLANGAAENRLAEALLEAGRDADALKLLTAKASWTRDVRSRIFHGVALARTARLEQASALAKSVKLPAKADPRLLRDAARLEAVLGQEARAAAWLVKAFEATPVANLPAFKASVRAHADFRRVLAGPAMTKAFATQSKQKALGCSGASDCGSCPKRGGCGGK